MELFQVEQWMNKNVVTCSREASASNVAELMYRNNIGSVVVVEGDMPVGIVTERDIVRQIVAKKRNPDQTSVMEIMSTSLVTVEVGTTISQVSEKMVKFRIKKMPVVDGAKLKGIITSTDIVRTMAAFNKLYEVKDIIELGA